MIRIREDIQAGLAKDPATRSALELFLTSPGLHALWSHQVARMLWNWGWYIPARIHSQWTRFWTGIEIHPGATIGNNVLLGAGAKIIGDIEIGDGAMIGANAVVTKNVPAGAVIVGPQIRPLN